MVTHREIVPEALHDDGPQKTSWLPGGRAGEIEELAAREQAEEQAGEME